MSALSADEARACAAASSLLNQTSAVVRPYPGRLGHVVLLRALVALDGVSLRWFKTDVDALTLVARSFAANVPDVSSADWAMGSSVSTGEASFD